MKKTKLPFILLLVLTMTSCGQKDSSSSSSSSPDSLPETADPLEEVVLTTPTGENIQTSLAYKQVDIQRGLSGVPSNEFDNDDGKFFFYFAESTRTFWMPNTFFALDIIYLNENLVIENIVKDLPAYNGTDEDEIPRAPAIRSRHVLEMKSTSPIADDLQIGDKLIWKSTLTIDETEEAMKENL